MNHIYKVIFNKSTGTFMAVTEYARAAGKGSAGAVGTAKSSGKFAKNLALSALSAAVMMVSGVSNAAVVISSTDSSSNTASANGNLTGIAIGQNAQVTGTSGGPIAIGGNAVASSTSGTVGVIAIGTGAQARGENNIALGGNASATGGNNAFAIGGGAQASANTSTAIGANANSAGANAVAISTGATASANAAVAIGSGSRSNGESTVAIGNSSVASNPLSVAVGGGATATSERTVAVGAQAQATGDSSVSIGNTTRATAAQTVAVGSDAKALSSFSTALGFRATASGGQGAATAIGWTASADEGSVAIGAAANATGGTWATAIGSQTIANKAGATALGLQAHATGREAIALGGVFGATDANRTLASGESAIAIGKGSQATGSQSIAVGVGNKVSAANAGAFGDPNTIGADATGSYAFGNNNTINQANTFVLGNSVTTTQANSVILGNASSDKAGTAVNEATVGPLSYSGFAGVSSANNGVVSVGSAANPRQIVNVGAGAITATSTDAINGSQLYAVADKLGQGFKVTEAGTLRGTVTPGETVNFIKGDNTTVTVTPETAVGVTTVKYDVNIDGETIVNDGGVLKAVAPVADIPTTTLNHNGATTQPFSTKPGEGNNFVTATNLANALNDSGFNLRANASGGTATDNARDKRIANGDTFVLTAGDNVTVDGVDNGFKVSVTGSGTVTATPTGSTTAPQTQRNQLINAGNVSAAINASGFRVADNGAVTSEIVNPGEIVDFVDGTNTTADVTVVGGRNTVTFNVNTNAALTPNQAGTPEAGKVTTSTPNQIANAQTVADAINNSGFNVTSGKTGTGVANGTTTELVNPGETVTFQAGDNMVVTQANGVFTYATAKDVVFNSVTSNSVTIPTTNGGSPIVINEAGINAGNNKITNVAPGTNPTDAATVGQLPTVVAGNGVQVSEGTNATGGKQYTVSATATPVNVETGDVNVDPTTGKAAGTGAGDKNLTDANTVADAINNAGFKVAQNGTAQPDLVNAGDTVDFVDGNNTTASVTTTPTGTTVTFDVKEATIAKPAQTGPEAGKLAAPAEDGVVTANNLVEAINNSGFNVTSGKTGTGVANGTTTELVNPGETVTFQAGDNMVVTQANGVFTYATAKEVDFDKVNADTITVGGDKAGNTSPVTITAGNTPNSGTISGLQTFLPNPAATAQPAPANLANAPVNNAATLGDVLNSGWNLQRGGTAVDFVNPYDTVNFEAGRNVTLDHRTDGKTSTIVINATAPAAVAGTTVEAGNGIVVNQVGDVVTISADTVPLTTVDGVTVTPASPNKLATAGDIANAINNAGFKVAENGTAQPDLVNPGDTVDFVDGNLTTARVTTTPAGATVTFDVNAQDVVEEAQLPVVYTDAAGNKLYKQPDGTFNTAPDGTGTPVQPENVVASMNNGAGSTTAPMTLGNVASTLPNTYNTDALNPTAQPVTTSQALPALTPAQLNNAATVGDVLNAGFNLQNNGAARDFVKPYDTVNFVNGAGTTAVVETNAEGTVSNVRYDVNYDNLTINGQTVTQNPDGTYSFNVTGGTGTGGLAAGPDAATAQPVNSTVVNGVGTTATVTPQVDANGNTVNVVKVDSPMAYVNEAAPADTSTPTNTTTLVGGDAAAPVQVLNVASALRNAPATPSATNIDTMTAAMQSPSTANGGNTNVAANLGDVLTAANIAKTEVTSNDGSVGITSSTGANGQTIYDLRVAGGANVDLNPIHKRIDDVEDDANAGVSSAMAMAALPQAYLPGKSMLTGGMATYNGEGAVAVGLSKLSDNGRWVLKISGSADTQGNAGAAVGAGFHF
ncbi:MAG: YadA-like family protein [Moraxella sp.]|nr:YadA-like family protein [Moraxella sp.]